MGPRLMVACNAREVHVVIGHQIGINDDSVQNCVQIAGLSLPELLRDERKSCSADPVGLLHEVQLAQCAAILD